MDDWIAPLLAALALPQVGLLTLFVVSLLSATLLPMGSEPALFGLLKLNPDLFWPAMFVATAGNTIGGAISWWMGYGAERAFESLKHRKPAELKALAWLERFGPKADDHANGAHVFAKVRSTEAIGGEAALNSYGRAGTAAMPDDAFDRTD